MQFSRLWLMGSNFTNISDENFTIPILNFISATLKSIEKGHRRNNFESKATHCALCQYSRLSFIVGLLAVRT